MSRHRNVRNFIDVDSEYYDDEVFGRSVDDDSPISPSLHQFIYNRNTNEEGSSSSPLKEEENEEMSSAVDQMSEILDTQFEFDTCKEALEMYDNDVGRAINHVMGKKDHVTSGMPASPEQLANAVNLRLKVKQDGENTPTNSITPTNCVTPVKCNTPKSGSPRSTRKGRETKETPVSVKKKSRPRDIDVLAILNAKKPDDKLLVNVAVVGHVDAGKSTLMGHLLCLLGHVSKRELHKNKTESQKLGKGSFAFAWVLDETGEERERGVTIDVAQTQFQTKKRIVNLLDAPGHKDFVPNMISGAAQADIAVLVIDATQGGFEAGFDQGGQTREHVVLVRALGVQSMIVAVNKMENVKWSKQRYDYIKSELSKFFKSVGFKTSEVVFVPVSGMEGDNLLEKSTTPDLTSWYTGSSLVETLDDVEPPKRPYDKPFRFVVTDVFKHPQLGLSVAGKVDAGYVTVGTPLVIMPGGDTTLLKSLTSEDRALDYTVAGEQCVMVLGGIDQTKLRNGNVICESHSKVRTTFRFRARVLVFNIAVPITKGFPVDLHYQTVSEPAVISRLISLHDKATGEVTKTKPRCLAKNQVALVEIKLQRAICLELFQDSKTLGRITCRYGGSTIAAGMVVEIT